MQFLPGKVFFPVFVFHSFVQFLNISCSKKFSPLMPINCLINVPLILFNSCSIREQFVFKKQINVFLMNLFMNIHVSKTVLSSFIFGGSAAQNDGLSLFNTRPARPANSLKTKDLKTRHFWLKFLSQGKPLRLKTLGEKFAHYFSHFPADPTLHTPPETDPTCSAAKPSIM